MKINQGPALGSMDTSSDLCELASMWTVDGRGSNTTTTGTYLNSFLTVLQLYRVSIFYQKVIRLNYSYNLCIIGFTSETRGNKVDGRSMRGKRKRPEPRTPILKKLSKDERAKARERAKDRTMAKMMMKMKGRSQLVKVVEEEVHDHGKMVKNNISEVNRSSFEATHPEEEIEELCKNDRFAVCNDFVMNKKDHISNESYDIINKFNSSFPMINHHRSQGAANSNEVPYYITDLHYYVFV